MTWTYYTQTKINIEKRRVTEEYLQELHKVKEEKGLKNVEGFKKKAYWALQNFEPKLHIAYGNLKLPKTTAIINLGTWFNCSGRKFGFCDICEECYDKAPEVMFKKVTKSRLEQEVIWRAVPFYELGKAISEKLLKHNKRSKEKVNLIRWSEVGELRNQRDLIKLIGVTDVIYHRTGIKSYIYTHNNSLAFDTPRDYLTINGSNFMVDNEYKVVKNKEKEFKTLSDLSNKRNCICDCTQCSYCSHKNHFTLIEELR